MAFCELWKYEELKRVELNEHKKASGTVPKKKVLKGRAFNKCDFNVIGFSFLIHTNYLHHISYLYYLYAMV